MRADGMRLEEIGRHFELSRERVRQIVDKCGGPSAAEVNTARRLAGEQQRADEVGTFVAAYSEPIKRLAAAGATRWEVEQSIQLLCPELSTSLVGAGLDRIDVLFNVAVMETNYSAAVIDAAVWYALGVQHGVSGEAPEALPFVDTSVATELHELLTGVGVSETHVSDVLATIALARRQVEAGEELGLSKKRYDSCRSDFLEAQGLDSSKGTTNWPPTSQTVMARFGRGYWSTALESLGMSPMSGGRKRGLLMFTSAEYIGGVADYIRFAAAHHSGATFAGYEEWTVAEDRVGRRRPSGPSVRLHFRTWTNAKRAAQTAQALQSTGPSLGTSRGPSSVARSALVASESALTTGIERLGTLDRATAPSHARDFLCQCVEEFEIRRRDWLRAVSQTDPIAFAERLMGPRGQLTKAQRSVAPVIENLDRVLTDRYLDGLLKGGDPTETDGWLRSDLQAELDLVPQVDRFRYGAARAVRNLLRHHSEEAQRRVTESLSDLSAVDDRFVLRRRPTSTVLADWLVSSNFRRLRVLCEVIPTLWRVAVVIETLAQPDSNAREG